MTVGLLILSGCGDRDRIDDYATNEGYRTEPGIETAAGADGTEAVIRSRMTWAYRECR